MAYTIVTSKCPRCNGNGVVPEKMHRGNAAGICYLCAGAKTITSKQYDAATLARREAKREADRAARMTAIEATRTANLEAFAVNDPSLAMLLDTIPGEVGSYARVSIADDKVRGSWADIAAFVMASDAQARAHAAQVAK